MKLCFNKELLIINIWPGVCQKLLTKMYVYNIHNQIKHKVLEKKLTYEMRI